MTQAQTFIDGEGDAWFARNRERLGQHDPVYERLRARAIVPTRALEVGCANGWRLKKLNEAYGCTVAGVEPSKAALDATELQVAMLEHGAADVLPWLNSAFDLVIYGFCLYLTDPEDWFTIVAEGDRVLADGGHIVIHDFADGGNPHALRYEHAEGVLAYHVNFSALWLMHPWYRLVDWHKDDAELVTILEKNTKRIPVWT